MYSSSYPKRNDGETPHVLTVRDVPVDGFWSISVYDAKGYFEKNALDAYSLNSLTAKPNPDGSFTVRFGGCDAGAANCLPIAAAGLHRSPVSPAARGSRRKLDLPRRTAGAMT